MQQTVREKEFPTESYTCFSEGMYSCPYLQQITKSASSFQIKVMRTIQRRACGGELQLTAIRKKVGQA